ncbi:sodium/calcium exchanger regulatory protein 1-like [Eurosta solidaginis]|uniref:sodium/calcium exchanger regulatory protein 1-like n=1 Tax=Eurosta solidaginis TaxID=178769 RepID=UPI003530D515
MKNQNAYKNQNENVKPFKKDEIEKDKSECSPQIWEGKIYKLVDESNYDNYLRALGVGPVLRKIENSVRPVIALRRNEKYYALITVSDFATTILRFQLCKPFDEETLDGRKMRTTMSMFNNVLIQHQLGDMPSTIVREFHDDKMIAKYMVGDVQAVRIFQVADELMCKEMWEAREANEAKPAEHESDRGSCCGCFGKSKKPKESQNTNKSEKEI